MMDQDLGLNERLAFLGIDERARADLAQLWPIVQPALPEILERFYTHLRAVPVLSALLGEQQDRLVRAQSEHWARLFAGRFDADYVASIRRIGMVHHRIGLEPRWYIGGYGFVMNELVRHLASRHRFSGTALSTRIVALNKAVLLDMDFAISIYQDALLQERQARGKALSDAIATFSGSVEASLAVCAQAAEGLADSAGVLDGATAEANGLTAQVSRAAERTATNMEAGAAAAEELAASVREIGGQAAQSATIAQNAVKSARGTNDNVAGLADQARAIGQVVELISSIAGQTNLLALNATIEAARAGEAGKGFAVVAAEVKTLAAQTATATTDISARVNAIQDATRRSAEDIREIVRVIEEASGIATAIASAVEEQSAVTSEIAQNVQETTSSTRDVVENLAGLGGATAAASNAALAVAAARESLETQLSRLRGDIATFLETARAA